MFSSEKHTIPGQFVFKISLAKLLTTLPLRQFLKVTITNNSDERKRYKKQRQSIQWIERK